MDQVKIGKFIAESRKQQNLTQSQLAEKLGITDRAISKWENGRAMPDSALMLELCGILKISVNDLLSGEIVENGENKEQQLLLDMANEIGKKNKVIWTSMCVIMIVSIVSLFAGILISAFLIPEGPWQLVAIILICIVFLMPCFYALKLEISVGAYKCKHCGNEIVPTYKEALMAQHKGFTRYLKCPKCGKKTWCKKVINK